MSLGMNMDMVIALQTAYADGFEAGREAGREETTSWISVMDRLPEHGDEYLVVRSSFGIYRAVDVCGYDKKSKKFGKIDMDYVYDGNGWYEVNNVTHWMPLPELPKEENK